MSAEKVGNEESRHETRQRVQEVNLSILLDISRFERCTLHSRAFDKGRATESNRKKRVRADFLLERQVPK